MLSFVYVIFAILGLSFLIFIHELGHYWMARRLGIKVDTFSIGFGTPVYSWVRDGVKWQIGWLLFGGYVKIAGMDNEEKNDSVLDGESFFSRKPYERILVAFMGPFVNLVFAIIAFSILWALGGRQKEFSEHTNRIGWLDPKSELYAKGVRPGDEVLFYNDQPFVGAKDHMIAPMMAKNSDTFINKIKKIWARDPKPSTSYLHVSGKHYDESSGESIPFNHEVKVYPHPSAPKDLKTVGIFNPASYVIYAGVESGETPFPAGSPMEKSGIQKGDRIVWVDGERIYSQQQLGQVVNDSRAILTVLHNGQVELRRVPRVKAFELRLDANFKEELIDWQFEAKLNGPRVQDLFVIPYNLTNECVVEAPVRFIDAEDENAFSLQNKGDSIDSSLVPGDKILAVDGKRVAFSYELLAAIQQRHLNMIVQRGLESTPPALWTEADNKFQSAFNQADLGDLVSGIGTQGAKTTSGDLFLLNPVTPKTRQDLHLSGGQQDVVAKYIKEKVKEAEEITDPEERAQAIRQIEELQNLDKKLYLGLPAIRDEVVQYNPGPFELFGQVVDEIWNTLGAIFTGSMNPKWLSGPIGIVQVVHERSMVSAKEALFWLGAISVNLGILNLLPLPVLDGGTIVFALWEMVTGRRLKPKTMEKLVIPFALLLMGFFIYLTFNDLSRILKIFF